MTLPLQGRAAAITGASQGLGLAIARAYVAAGASVIMCARDADAIEQARRSARRCGAVGTGGARDAG